MEFTPVRAVDPDDQLQKEWLLKDKESFLSLCLSQMTSNKCLKVVGQTIKTRGRVNALLFSSLTL